MHNAALLPLLPYRPSTETLCQFFRDPILTPAAILSTAHGPLLHTRTRHMYQYPKQVETLSVNAANDDLLWRTFQD